MATCRDCFNVELCTKWAITYDETPLWDKPVECDFFKDKSQYAEVKHGEWVEERGTLDAQCSLCGEFAPEDNSGICSGVYNYCPNCGAKMDGGKDG